MGLLCRRLSPGLRNCYGILVVHPYFNKRDGHDEEGQQKFLQQLRPRLQDLAGPLFLLGNT
jgi:hypothetical protein